MEDHAPGECLDRDAAYKRDRQRRKQAVTRANEALAQAVHFAEAGTGYAQLSVAHCLIGLLSLALMHERDDDLYEHPPCTRGVESSILSGSTIRPDSWTVEHSPCKREHVVQFHGRAPV